MLKFFGGVVYEFGLEKAIGTCLVPYRYYPIEVKLNAEEEDRFIELTGQIKRLAFAANLADGSPEKERLQRFCMQRRRVIEAASNKINAFEDLVKKSPEVLNRSLVFCTDKDSEQLKSINAALSQLGIPYHQLTQKETSKRKLLMSLIDNFNIGILKTLTSMRVLDEGFNVPQTEHAFLLASNTVKRQWIQRLGRVLRLSPSTDKKEAVIYDFIALPLGYEENLDQDLKRLLLGEFERITFFSKLSSNSSEKNGGLELAAKLLKGLEKI